MSNALDDLIARVEAGELYWAAFDKDSPCVTIFNGKPGVDLRVHNGHDAIPARSWLLVILRAMKEGKA